MAPENQRQTFISYSRINKEFALKLAKDLKAVGFPVWLDQLDIPAGARWDDALESALKSCEIFMVILTPASTASENVKDEIGYAIDAGKRILPILLENAILPFRLRRFQYVDFTSKSFDEGIESAKQLLKTLMDEPVDHTQELAKEKRGGESGQKSHTQRGAMEMEENRMSKEEKHPQSVRKTTIRGDQNVMSGTISGGIFVQGRGSRVIANQASGADANEINALFDNLYRYIESRAPDPDVDKEEIVETVQKIQEESSKGEQVNETKLARWMDNLNKVAPDIVDVALASLGGPVSGVTAVLKKIADHARQQSKP